jgi:hypothetical protein
MPGLFGLGKELIQAHIAPNLQLEKCVHVESNTHEVRQ